jgi:transcription initiation factor IIE alpha subunit
MTYQCPSCQSDTQYAAFSGGREFYCPSCGNQGNYPDDAPPIRAHLLQTEDGRTRLRAEMDQEIARRHDPKETHHA